MNVSTTTQQNRLMGDLNTVIQDSEELLEATASQAGDSTKASRERARLRLDQAKVSLHHLQDAAIEKAKAAGHRTDDYVHEHPWRAIGTAAGFGLVVGLLIGRR